MSRRKHIAAQQTPPAAENPTPLPSVLTDMNDRAGLVLIRRALREGWKIPPHLMATLPSVIEQMIANARHDRDRLRAVETILAMQRANMEALVHADRCERLDGGGATERVELAPITLKPGGGGS